MANLRLAGVPLIPLMYSFHLGSYTPTRGCLVRFFHAPQLVYGEPRRRSSMDVCKSLS